MTNEPIVVEQTYDTEAGKVWKAIISKEQMKEWYFDLFEFKSEPGFEFEFSAGPDEKKYRHLCQVKEAVPGKKLSYSWRYDGYAGDSLVTFELFPEGTAKTKLRLTHAGVDTFPKSNPDLAKKNFAEGWTSILGTSLKNYLADK